MGVEHESMSTINFDGEFSIKGYKGVAFYLMGWEQRWEPDYVWILDDDNNEHEVESGEGQWVDDVDGRVIAVMVGDDHEWKFDTDDLTEINRDDYCSCCGQIGCGWGS